MTTTADAIEDLLAQAGVDIGRPEKRRERAVRLVNEGMAEEDLAELVTWSHRTRRKLHTVGHWVGWATSSTARWRATLTDVRKLKAAAKAQAGGANETPAAREPSPEQAAARTRGLAYCRIVGDGAAEQVVADELGVSAENLREMVAQERIARGVPVVPLVVVRKRAKPAVEPAAQRGEELW